MPRGRPKGSGAQPKVEKPKRSASEKQKMLEEKLARQAHFVKMAEEQRERVKKMSTAEKQVYLDKKKEATRATVKRLQGNLIFPVRRMRKDLRTRLSPHKGKRGGARITTESAIFSAAVVEYLVAEVLELAGECAHQLKKKRIVPRHIMSAIRMDEELATLCPKETVFTSAGCLQKDIPLFLQKNNVPRKDWNQNWNNVMNVVGISKPMNDTASDVNNNKKDASVNA